MCSGDHPYWKPAPWTLANRASSGLSSLHYSMRHYVLCNHSHARIGTETWEERRRKMGRKLRKPVGGGREGKRDQVWALTIPCHQTSTGCPVPHPSLAVSVPGKRFPGGRSCSCNAPHGAELRMGPSPAVANTPTLASAKKPKTHRVTEVMHLPLGPPIQPQTVNHIC